MVRERKRILPEAPEVDLESGGGGGGGGGGLNNNNNNNSPHHNSLRHQRDHSAERRAKAELIRTPSAMAICVSKAAQWLLLCIKGAISLLAGVFVWAGLWLLTDRYVPGGQWIWKEIIMIVTGTGMMIATNTFFSNAGMSIDRGGSLKYVGKQLARGRLTTLDKAVFYWNVTVAMMGSVLFWIGTFNIVEQKLAKNTFAWDLFCFVSGGAVVLWITVSDTGMDVEAAPLVDVSDGFEVAKAALYDGQVFEKLPMATKIRLYGKAFAGNIAAVVFWMGCEDIIEGYVPHTDLTGVLFTSSGLLILYLCGRLEVNSGLLHDWDQQWRDESNNGTSVAASVNAGINAVGNKLMTTATTTSTTTTTTTTIAKAGGVPLPPTEESEEADGPEPGIALVGLANSYQKNGVTSVTRTGAGGCGDTNGKGSVSSGGGMAKRLTGGISAILTAASSTNSKNGYRAASTSLSPGLWSRESLRQNGFLLDGDDTDDDEGDDVVVDGNVGGDGRGGGGGGGSGGGSRRESKVHGSNGHKTIAPKNGNMGGDRNVSVKSASGETRKDIKGIATGGARGSPAGGCGGGGGGGDVCLKGSGYNFVAPFEMASGARPMVRRIDRGDYNDGVDNGDGNVDDGEEAGGDLDGGGGGGSGAVDNTTESTCFGTVFISLVELIAVTLVWTGIEAYIWDSDYVVETVWRDLAYIFVSVALLIAMGTFGNLVGLLSPMTLYKQVHDSHVKSHEMQPLLSSADAYGGVSLDMTSGGGGDSGGTYVPVTIDINITSDEGEETGGDGDDGQPTRVSGGDLGGDSASDMQRYSSFLSTLSAEEKGLMTSVT